MLLPDVSVLCLNTHTDDVFVWNFVADSPAAHSEWRVLTGLRLPSDDDSAVGSGSPQGADLSAWTPRL